MNEQSKNEQHADKLLNALIDEIRYQDIPPLPVVTNKVPRSSIAIFDLPFGNRTMSIGVPLIVTLAVTLVFGSFVLFPVASNTAFAQVQEALDRVKTIQYTVLDQHDNWLGQPKTFETRVVIVEPQWSRSESEHSGIWISDWDQERRLNIRHDRQTATFYETSSSKESRAKSIEFLDKFRNIPVYATRRIGKTDFDGTPAEQFYVQFNDREFVVTINSITKLPLHMKYSKDGFQEVFTDFVFDEEVDTGIFSLEAPRGYKIVEHQLADPPEFASSLVVSPGSGISDCNFGSSVEEVTKFLGKPSKRRDHKSTGPDGFVHSSTTLDYNSLGLSLCFNSEGLASMLCQSQARNGSIVHDFAGKTDKGIGIGDSRDKLNVIYGEPDYENEATVRYVRVGISFYLDKGKVSGIDVNQPLDPRLNFHIDPKTGVQRTWVGEQD